MLNRRQLTVNALATGALALIPGFKSTAIATTWDKVKFSSVPIIYCDGIHCDANGLEAFFDNKPYKLADSIPYSKFYYSFRSMHIEGMPTYYLRNATFYLGRSVVIDRRHKPKVIDVNHTCWWKLDDDKFQPSPLLKQARVTLGEDMIIILDNDPEFSISIQHQRQR